MEGENCKRVPSVPTNFLTLAQLQERWLREKQKQKEKDEKEAARLQKQREEEQEEEDRNRREKEEQQRKTRIQQNYGVRPRSNNVPRPPFHRNRLNQCPGRVDGQKPAKTHIAEETDDYVKRRTGWKRGEPICRNRRNQSPVGGSGDTEVKIGNTHVAEVVLEDAGVKIGGDSIKKTGSEKRGNPRSVKEDSTGVLLAEKGADKEVKVGGEGRIGEKKDWVDGSVELERKFEKISLSGGGGEGFNGRHSGYVHGRGNRWNYDKGYGGIDWRRKRNSNLVWVKKEG